MIVSVAATPTNLESSRGNSTFCKRPGLSCKNCLDVVLCAQSAGNGYTEYPMESCPLGRTCLDGACTTEPNPICLIHQHEFVCRTRGVFPDPFDCKKFHYCVPSSNSTELEHFEDVCGCNFGYSVSSNNCNLDLGENKGECGRYPVPFCKGVGQTDALEGKPNLYYLCLPYPGAEESIYPFLYACDNDKVYSKEEYICK